MDVYTQFLFRVGGKASHILYMKHDVYCYCTVPYIQEGEESGEECEDVEVPVVMGEGEEENDEGESEGEMSVVGSEMDTDSVVYADTEKYDAQFDLEAEEKQ